MYYENNNIEKNNNFNNNNYKDNNNFKKNNNLKFINNKNNNRNNLEYEFFHLHPRDVMVSLIFVSVTYDL